MCKQDLIDTITEVSARFYKEGDRLNGERFDRFAYAIKYGDPQSKRYKLDLEALIFVTYSAKGGLIDKSPVEDRYKDWLKLVGRLYETASAWQKACYGEESQDMGILP